MGRLAKFFKPPPGMRCLGSGRARAGELNGFAEPFALFATALAEAVGVTSVRVNETIRGRRGINAEVALRLTPYFNIWLCSHFAGACAMLGSDLH